MPLDNDTLDLLVQRGYISQRQRTDPTSIPMKDGDLDWSDPQFKGLHPLAKNPKPDLAAQTAATPDLRYGTGATGQANLPPPAAPPVPAQPVGPPPIPPGTAPVMAQGPQAPRQPGMIPMGMPGGVGVPGKSPAAVDEMNAALQAQKTAAVNEARAEAEANDAAAQSNIGAQGYLRGESDQAQEAEDTRRHAMGEQQAEYDAMRRDAASAGKNLDYDRWIKSGGAGKRITMVLAEALGAAGAALTHTENSAQKIIEAEINRDVEQQKDQLASKQAAVREKASDLQRMRERFGDERSGEAALRAQRWEAYKLGAQAEAQRAQSPVLEAKAQQIGAVADQKTAEFHMQIASHGAGANPQKQIQDLTEKIYLDSKGAMSPEDAQRQAIKLVMGADVRPGEAGPAGWGTGGKGAIAAQAANAVGAGAPPPGTNFFQHPINAITNRLGVAGTEGKEAGNKQADANAAFIKAAVAQGVMSSRSAMNIDPAKPPPAMRGLIIGPNDTDKEIAEKRVRQREWLGAAGAGLPQQPLDLEESD